MPGFIAAFKHAFAIGKEEPSEAPLPKVLEKLAATVVSHKLETIALVILEAAIPLNFLASQTAAAFLPLLSGWMSVSDLEAAVLALEDRKTLRQLSARIEILSRESEVSC